MQPVKISHYIVITCTLTNDFGNDTQSIEISECGI